MDHQFSTDSFAAQLSPPSKNIYNIVKQSKYQKRFDKCSVGTKHKIIFALKQKNEIEQITQNYKKEMQKLPNVTSTQKLLFDSTFNGCLDYKKKNVNSMFILGGLLETAIEKLSTYCKVLNFFSGICKIDKTELEQCIEVYTLGGNPLTLQLLSDFIFLYFLYLF